MGEPSFRKPIFDAVWRYPEPDLRRLQRVGRRGLLRLAVLTPLTFGVMSLVAISLVYATSGIALLEAALIGTMAASVCVGISRLDAGNVYQWQRFQNSHTVSHSLRALAQRL